MELEPRDWILMIGATSSAIATIVAFLALYTNKRITREAHAWNLENQRNQLFLNLRDRYLGIRLKIPEKVYLPDYPAHESNEEWKYVQHYWYNVFDEWYTTTQLNDGSFNNLWDDYFGPATQSSLRYPAMIKVLQSMISGSVSFGEQKTAFIAELNRLNQALSADQRVVSELKGTPDQSDDTDSGSTAGP